MIITIDPGHGGKDPGAVVNGVYEKYIALQISLKAKKILEFWPGFQPVLTRTEDLFVPLRSRALLADENNASVFVSIHTNAHKGEALGAEVFYFPGSKEGQRIAMLVQDEIIYHTNRRDRGVKEARFTVLASTRVPAVLVETGFLTGPGKVKLMQTDKFQWLTAVGICVGLRKYKEGR